MGRGGLKAFVVAAIGIAFLLAFVVSPLASKSPDGLQKVAREKGFAKTAEAHPLDGSPLANYAFKGIDSTRLSKGVAGAIGISICFAAAYLWMRITRRRGVTKAPMRAEDSS
jgi:PDGLE domain